MQIIITNQKEIDPREIDKAKKRMEWLTGFMTIKFQFVYQVLGMMNKVCVPYYETMGVRVLGSGNFQLIYDPIFVNGLKDTELTYVMYHEILHLVLHHCTTRNYDDRELANIAHDLAVNELVPTDSQSCMKPMKDGKLFGLFVSELKKSGMYSDIKEMQSAEWYYNYLKQKAKENESKNGKDPGKEDGEGQGQGQGKGDNKDKDNNKGGGSGKGVKPDLKSSFDKHGEWKEDEIGDEKIRAKVHEISKSDTWGNIESSAKELILAAQTRRINWRNLLRQFYGNMAWHEKEATRKRPNRRTGLIHPGNRKIHVDRHLVVADTSGSTQGLLPQFLSVINEMTEYFPIDFMQCDCGIKELPKPFDRKRKEYTFTGLGGTDFQPIIDIVNERRYKSVVILTDGAAPECTQPKARVVWVLPEGMKPPVEWGMRIHMAANV
jgi:predicted metal-dependent peptidase